MNSNAVVRSPRNRRILVVDPDEDSLNILLEPLRWEGYDARGVSSVREGLQLIESWTPHIALMDLPAEREGLQQLQQVRQRLPHSSCLIISDDSSTESIIACLDSGADDYIIKPFVPLELLARIRTHLRMRDLQEQLIFANERLKEMVDTDDLTGLYNMRSLYQRLDFEIERARRFNRGVACVMMDMDYFKTVNDGHNHLFGSHVLTEVGKIIKINTRNIDIPARYGGDEFLVVLTEVTYEGAMLFCERLRRNIEKNHFTNGVDSIRLTISIGFAMHPMTEKINSREFVRRADHALYEAKRQGRNRVCFYEADSNIRVLGQGAAKPPRKPAGKVSLKPAKIPAAKLGTKKKAG
jgi:two-component system cell cycle response regulator